MLKKLPIGIETFSEIIEKNMLYVDKTESIYNLLNNYKYIFLSRPRRFGKSLLMDTIHELYEGNQDLFKELYIYDKWDWSKSYPVIKLTFSGGIHNRDDFENDLTEQFSLIYKKFDIDFDDKKEVRFQFSSLIVKINEKFNKKVVILVDEYDKPILDNLENIEEAKIIRDLLKDFYTKIKANDAYVKFTMLTGVSKFSKVSIFSGLNNLTDISLDRRYGAVCGYTQNDLESTFQPYLQDVAMDKLKLWYNGYNFLGKKVYNPFDILLFISQGKLYRNYWFETGTPSYLMTLIKDNKYFLPDLNDIEVSENIVNSFDITDISLETIMLQAGYLTIKEMVIEHDVITYILDFPNLEVKRSFYNYLFDVFFRKSVSSAIKRDALRVFATGEIDKLEDIIRQLFASIAYNNFTKNDIASYEGFYASVLYAYFASLGVELIAEDVTNKGRIDLTIKMNDKVYLFEFKVINEEPLKQIKTKKYYEKYRGEIYMIGIVFDKKDRNITKFEWEKQKNIQG